MLGGRQLQANTVEVVQLRINAKQITVMKSERRLKVFVITFFIVLSKREAAELCILMNQFRVIPSIYTLLDSRKSIKNKG